MSIHKREETDFFFLTFRVLDAIPLKSYLMFSNLFLAPVFPSDTSLVTYTASVLIICWLHLNSSGERFPHHHLVCDLTEGHALWKLHLKVRDCALDSHYSWTLSDDFLRMHCSERKAGRWISTASASSAPVSFRTMHAVCWSNKIQLVWRALWRSSRHKGCVHTC